jgi:SAM-dependent methyltransferase
MSEGIAFSTGLYAGTADDYDRFRLPYPQVMLDDMLGRIKPSGSGRLLDLACGTGQLTFAIARFFGDVWAVDQEADMVEKVRQKSAATGSRVRAVVSTAEALIAPDDGFELVIAGNAFHRLQRDVVAGNIMRWLRAGGYAALFWSNAPWSGGSPWQQSLSTLLDRWKRKLGVESRVPINWNESRLKRPDGLVLADAGLEGLGRFRFPTLHEWTPEGLIGFIYSTSFLSRCVVGPHAPSFESDLEREFARYGPLRETIEFVYELSRKPAKKSTRRRARGSTSSPKPKA